MLTQLSDKWTLPSTLMGRQCDFPGHTYDDTWNVLSGMEETIAFENFNQWKIKSPMGVVDDWKHLVCYHNNEFYMNHNFLSASCKIWRWVWWHDDGDGVDTIDCLNWLFSTPRISQSWRAMKVNKIIWELGVIRLFWFSFTSAKEKNWKISICLTF